MDLLHQDSGMYQIYNEYLKVAQQYAVDSKIKALSIRYYRINMTRTNTDEEMSMMMTKKYGSTYDIYDLTQIMELSPLSYTNENAEDNQGVIRTTNGTMTLLGIAQPLPGDLFHFYSANENESEEDIEYFTVDNVTFNQSNSSMNINQIEFSTANITKRSVDSLTILNQFYYVKEFKKYFSSDLYQNYTVLLNSRNEDVDFVNKFYNAIKCTYRTGNETENKQEIDSILNQVIYYLNDTYRLNFNPILMDPPSDIPQLKSKIENNEIVLNDTGYNSGNLADIINNNDILLIRKISKLQYLYDSFTNFKLPDNKEIGTDIEKTNNTVKDLDGNIIQ